MAKTTIVADRFRTNPLSTVPGGTTVTVVYSNGSKCVYKNVKNPWAYSSKIKKQDPTIANVLFTEGQ